MKKYTGILSCMLAGLLLPLSLAAQSGAIKVRRETAENSPIVGQWTSVYEKTRKGKIRYISPGERDTITYFKDHTFVMVTKDENHLPFTKWAKWEMKPETRSVALSHICYEGPNSVDSLPYREVSYDNFGIIGKDTLSIIYDSRPKYNVKYYYRTK